MSDLTLEQLVSTSYDLRFIVDGPIKTAGKRMFKSGCNIIEAVVHEIGHHEACGINLCSMFFLDNYLDEKYKNRPSVQDKQEIEVIAATLHIFKEYDILLNAENYVNFLVESAPWKTGVYKDNMARNLVFRSESMKSSLFLRNKIIKKLSRYSRMSVDQLMDLSDKTEEAMKAK